MNVQSQCGYIIHKEKYLSKYLINTYQDINIKHLLFSVGYIRLIVFKSGNCSILVFLILFFFYAYEIYFSLCQNCESTICHIRYHAEREIKIKGT